VSVPILLDTAIADTSLQMTLAQKQWRAAPQKDNALHAQTLQTLSMMVHSLNTDHLP
jgi:hypothetical protein